MFLSGFCHFGLVLFLVLWQSPDTPIMSCLHVSARLRVCSSALSSACLVSCWSVVFGSRHSCLEFWFCVGVQTLTLHFLSCCVSVRSRVRLAVRSSVHVCSVLLHAVRVIIGCVRSCYVLWCVAHSLWFLFQHISYFSCALDVSQHITCTSLKHKKDYWYT